MCDKQVLCLFSVTFVQGQQMLLLYELLYTAIHISCPFVCLFLIMKIIIFHKTFQFELLQLLREKIEQLCFEKNPKKSLLHAFFGF